MSSGPKLIVHGIVVGKSPVGDGSVRAHIYTDALGLISAYAKSAREERSQLRAHLEVGTHGYFYLVRGKNFWRLTGASKTMNAHFMLSEKKGAQEALSRVLSFVRQFVRGEGSDPYFYSALSHFVIEAPRISEEKVRGLECLTVLRMLATLGYVEDSRQVGPFLNLPYDESLLARVREARPALLKAINDGITASGLT
jgi:recombinational DNA repair protein (RecF pathway)